MFDEQAPSSLHYDSLIVLGATVPVMLKRIAYTIKLLTTIGVSVDEIILLSSDRPLSQDEKESCDSLATGIQTEVEALTYLFDEAKKTQLRQCKEVKVFSCPLLTHRPNRIDTLDFLCNHYLQKHRKPNHLLFITHCPEFYSQKIDIMKTIPTRFPEKDVETVGDRPDDNITHYLLFRAISTLGATFWGDYERVASELGIDRSQQQLESRKDELCFDAIQLPQQSWSYFNDHQTSFRI
jgi:hypothetical protein